MNTHTLKATAFSAHELMRANPDGLIDGQQTRFYP